jgi:hypothetical protein
VRVVDEVPAGAEPRGAEALGAGAHGQDGGALRVLSGGEEEGSDDAAAVRARRTEKLKTGTDGPSS